MTKKKIYDVLPQLQLERLVKVAKRVGMPITRNDDVADAQNIFRCA